MRRRKLSLVATLGGFPMRLGEVGIEDFAKVREADTTLVCPDCGAKPSWLGQYTCSCGKTYNHWSKLKRIVTATREVVEQVKLTVAGEPSQAIVFVMRAEEFSKRYADAILKEHGITAEDTTTAKNVQKLLIAVERLGMVVIVRFKDTYEERICLLSVNQSNRAVLREIIPMNLAKITETLRVDMDAVTEQDITEAQQLIKMLKQADEEVFIVHDHRTIGLEAIPLESPKVQTLQEILAQVAPK